MRESIIKDGKKGGNKMNSIDSLLSGEKKWCYINVELDQSVARVALIDCSCRRIQAAQKISDALNVSSTKTDEMKKKYLQLRDYLNPEQVNPVLREKARDSLAKLDTMYATYIWYGLWEILLEPSTSPWGILGISADAGKSRAKEIYLRLVRVLHPDMVPPQMRREATLTMQRLNNAYDYYRKKGY